MKKNIPILITILSFLFFANGIYGQGVEKNHKDSLNTLIKEYYALNLKIFQSNSTVDDIDAVFDLYTDDFVYVHPKYGGTYSRKDLYDGYVNNQKNGSYNGRVTDIKIVNTIIGLNAVAVEKKFIHGTDEGELEMTLFEFREGKISKIFEYW